MRLDSEYSIIRSIPLFLDVPTNCTLNSLTDNADRVLTSTSSSLLHGFPYENLEKFLGVTPHRRSTVVQQRHSWRQTELPQLQRHPPPRAPPSWTDIVEDPASFSDLPRARECSYSLIDLSTGLDPVDTFFHSVSRIALSENSAVRVIAREKAGTREIAALAATGDAWVPRRGHVAAGSASASV